MEAAPERQPAVDAEACVRADAALVRASTSSADARPGCCWHSERRPGRLPGHLRAVDGSSDSVLSDRLSELCNVGLATLTVEEGPPISVAYQLTDAGRALLPALEQITRWAEEHLPPLARANQVDLGSRDVIPSGDYDPKGSA